MYMRKVLNKIIFYLTHQRCELCRSWEEELYVYEHYMEAGTLACEKCCNNK
jgi:hypothetical protein